MLKVGLTGGIGSGKTTVCRIFEQLGIPVYYADRRAKALMVEQPAVREQIRQQFGEQVYREDGALNRAYLADLVFDNPEKLQQLNAIVHPAVGEDALQWHANQKDVPYTLKEAALIYESESFRDLDAVVVVTAPEEIRIQRVMERDRVSRESVLARMARQMPEAEKVERGDFIIYNDGHRSIIRQVLIIHEELVRRSESQSNANQHEKI